MAFRNSIKSIEWSGRRRHGHRHQSIKKLTLLSISLLVLVVACANVANLMLARGMKRWVETSVRMALGSARSRLIRQMLTESVLLGCLGGLAGLAVAYCRNTKHPGSRLSGRRE